MNTERLHTLSTHRHKSPKPRRQKDREIARLRGELSAERGRTAKLEREIANLKRELQVTGQASSKKSIRRLSRRGKSARKEELLLMDADRRARYYRKRSFLRYLVDSFRESMLMEIITKFRRYLKRFQLLQMLFPILLAVGAFVAVGIVSPLALLILCVGVILPTALILLDFHRMNKHLRQELVDRRIRIMIPPKKGAMEKDSFFVRNARAMAAEDDVTVIVVTPYLCSGRGMGGRKSFFTARKEADTLYLVRSHYFFTLRRRVLDRLDSDVTVIY